MRRGSRRAGRGDRDDIGWIFSAISDLSLSLLGMLFVLLLYIVLYAAKLDAGDVAMRQVRQRQEELKAQVIQELSEINETVDASSNGNNQTFRFVETSGRSQAGFFEPNKAVPSPRLVAILTRMRRALAGNQELYERLMVQGHTDTQLSPNDPWKLSTERAAAVVIFLTDKTAKQFVNPRQVLVSAVGYGEWLNGKYFAGRDDAPMEKDYDTKDGWHAACRRIDLMVIYKLNESR